MNIRQHQRKQKSGTISNVRAHNRTVTGKGRDFLGMHVGE